MKFLLTGSSGQLGQELLPRLRTLGSVQGVDRAAAEDTIRLDLSDFTKLKQLLGDVQPDVIVNAAAYTAVDAAERDPVTAFRLNAELPAALARWCGEHSGRLLHYSTDYVFDGHASEPYRESDVPGPLNTYGQSKLAGEWAIQASGCDHLILRTSWVYSTHGKNFVLSMLKLAEQRPELGVVSDQEGCPTWARNLAAVTADVLQQLLAEQQDWGGIFHYCDNSKTTWYDFASLIFAQAVELGMLPALPRLNSIRSSEFPQLARRPRYSVLDASEIEKIFHVEPPGLESSLRACLREKRS